MSGEEQGKPQGGRSWKLNRRPPYSLEVKRIGDHCERAVTLKTYVKVKIIGDG
ncbi:hypothetical protein RF55_14347, partial [Lasius niger]